MPSKDQLSVDDNETKDQKGNRGLDICIESFYKADHSLRGCAHNQRCFYEMMEIRDKIIEYAKTLRR